MCAIEVCASFLPLCLGASQPRTMLYGLHVQYSRSTPQNHAGFSIEIKCVTILAISSKPLKTEGCGVSRPDNNFLLNPEKAVHSRSIVVSLCAG